MATFTLNIHGDLSELAAIAAALGGGQAITVATDTAPVAEKPARAAKAQKAAPEPEAAKVETPAVVEPASEPEPAAETPAVAIVEGGQTNAAAPGDVTLDMLKDELGKLLKKEGFGAKAAQDLIRQHGNGAAGLSQAAAIDYPAIHAALVAANAG